MAKRSKDDLKQIRKDLESLGMFTGEQNKKIQDIKGEIHVLADVCRKESQLFKEKYGDEWKNLQSIQHTLKVINTNLLLVNKKFELVDFFVSDIYERVTKLSDVISSTLSSDKK